MSDLRCDELSQRTFDELSRTRQPTVLYATVAVQIRSAPLEKSRIFEAVFRRSTTRDDCE